jgi:DNA mismatch repair protein MutL
MRIFVNGRAIRDRMIIHAVTEGLRGFLMKGKNPCGLIHLVLPPDEVDVNVHPAKHEVRFRNSRDVHSLLSEAVAQAMLGYQQVMKTTLFGADQAVERMVVPLDLEQEATHFFDSSFVSLEQPVNDFSSESDQQTTEAHNTRTTLFPPKAKTNTPPPPASAQRQSLFTTAEPLQKSSYDERIPPGRQESSGHEPRPDRHNLLIIGQYDHLYIFCKNSEGLLVIDQHAAHERLLYEKLRKQYLAKAIVRQTLMFPETVELSLFQAQLVEKNSREIDRIGFSIREFGGNTYIISAVPALAGGANPRELFQDILAQFGSENDRGDAGGFLDTILATMACRAAVKAGTELSMQEIDHLLSEMTKADLFSHCPHGRPVVKQFTRDEVKKWFYRT